jgi:hypothetical protein
MSALAPGTYVVTITRSTTVTSALSLTGNGAYGVLTLSPAFLPTIFAYTVTVPYKVSSVFATATFSLGTMQFNLSAATVQLSLTSTATSASAATLTVAANTIRLVSSQDGQLRRTRSTTS